MGDKPGCPAWRNQQPCNLLPNADRTVFVCSWCGKRIEPHPEGGDRQ